METPEFLDSADEAVYELTTRIKGPEGRLPLDGDHLASAPSGDIFGWSQNVGMGWRPDLLGRDEYLILSTQGGIRRPDGTPAALGYHTGHWEVGVLMEEAAAAFSSSGAIPFAAFCSDPCDGRTNGTDGMLDSLAYRNDAAIVLRRLIRSLPTRKGVLGVATCDKGLPAMVMALAGSGDLPSILVPGGVSLLSEEAEDLGKVQSIGARFAHGEISLDHAAEMGCRACGSPGGGCQFLGTAATSQVVAEAMGMTLPHSALCPSGTRAWKDMARRSSHALMELVRAGRVMAGILDRRSLRNALVVHAAFGGSTNLILHLPAFAHAAGLERPTVEDWRQANSEVPRLADIMPNGPHGYATVQAYLAGGVPEVMLHLRNLGLLDLTANTVSGLTAGDVLEWWEQSERRVRMREKLTQLDGIDPDKVIMSPERARAANLGSTVTFPGGNIAPEGSVVKSTAIDPSLLSLEGVFLHEGPARVFGSEAEAIAAVKSTGDDRIREGDVLVLAGVGPIGAGMPETYQLTSALRYLRFGGRVPLLTDARFSGVSTGACIGHISPEAMAGGAIGRLRDGDRIRIRIDCRNGAGSIDLVLPGRKDSDNQAVLTLNGRKMNSVIKGHPRTPNDTRLWAALQNVAGGSWGGCVYDVDQIIKVLEAGQRRSASRPPPVL
jgi:putative YjhG/YagF family dehydratase